MTSPRSTTKIMRMAGVLVLVVGTLVVLAPAGGAAPAPCKVTDMSTMGVYTGTGSNLQTAIDEAQPGTKLTIRGTCVGNFTVAKDLSLNGYATTPFPTPTLNGNAAGTVLSVNSGSVTVRNLTITNGLSPYGGGISNDLGNVTLAGSTSVTLNTAGWGGTTGYGGGIYNEQGTLTLMGSASVSGNTSDNGGGINNLEGTVTLRGSSSVTGNTANAHGGGICNDAGTTTLRDSSVVSGNTAVYAGGGISTFNSGPIPGALTLLGSSSVTGNTASGAGGIYISSFQPARYARTKVTMKDSSSVTGNTATDGPGGGIVNDKGVLTLMGSSSVTGNGSGSVGGGIYNTHRVNACTTWTGAISPNNPDDPPSVIWITC